MRSRAVRKQYFHFIAPLSWEFTSFTNIAEDVTPSRALRSVVTSAEADWSERTDRASKHSAGASCPRLRGGEGISQLRRRCRPGADRGSCEDAGKSWPWRFLAR